MKSVGSRLLAEKLVGDWTQTKLAHELGVSRQAVSYWADGTSQPKPKLMARLEDLLEIPMRSWAERRSERKTGTDG